MFLMWRVPPGWKGYADFRCGHQIYETSFLRLARRAWEHVDSCEECRETKECA